MTTIASQPRNGVRQAVPFCCVRDIERSARFYRDVLGFQMTNEWRVRGYELFFESPTDEPEDTILPGD